MGNENLQKTVLAIDTAMGGVSVGLIAGKHIVSRMIETEREQAAILVPIIQEVVEEAEIEFSQVDLIGCSKGPGSFTGLRIGLTTARTMAMALDIPVIGLNTLDVMARHYQADKNLLVVLETKRQDFYARFYDKDYLPLTEPVALPAQEILNPAPEGGFVIGGDCLERFKSLVGQNLDYLEEYKQPDPILMAQIALETFERDGEQGKPEPLYLRGADVSQPKNPPRKLAGV